MKLHLICDVSGSMSEGGKRFALRTAVMTIAQWVRLGYSPAEISLCGWASKVRHFADWSMKDEFPEELLSCSGSSKGEVLIQWLGEKPEGKVLLLTDGFWTRDDERVLRNWSDGLPPNTLWIIKIGADANPHRKGINVFDAEQLFGNLFDWLEGGVA